MQLIRVVGRPGTGKTTAALSLAWGRTLYVGRSAAQAAAATRTSPSDVHAVGPCAGLQGQRYDTIIIDAGALGSELLGAYLLPRLKSPGRLVMVAGDKVSDLGLWSEVKRLFKGARPWLVWCSDPRVTPRRARL